MDNIIILLLIIYLVSPIPLLGFLIAALHGKKKAKKELSEFQLNSHKREENYRQYVNQLQNHIKQLDPKTDLTQLQPRAEKTVPVPGAQVQQAQVPAQQAQAPVQPIQAAPAVPATPVAAQAPATYTPPAYMENRAIPQPSMPQASFPVQPVPSENKDASHGNLILVIGVLFLILASVGFISATWSAMGIGVRAVCLFSFSAIFLGASVLAKTKFKLPNTSLAFYSIGSTALPITIFGAGAFELFGDNFGFGILQIYNTFLLAFSALMILMIFGTAFFRSRVFAAGALGCLSFNIFTLAKMFEYPYSLNVLLVSLFASAAILMVPLVKKIREESLFHPFAKVFEIYAIINLYVMTLVAFTMSSSSIWSGIFLLLLGAAFLIATALRKETGLLSLPMIVLLLVGLAQIIQPESLLGGIVWVLASSLTLITLSMLPVVKKIFANVLLVFGVILLTIAVFPVFYYMITYANWGFTVMSIILIAAFVFLSIRKKHPLYFAGALIPAFTLLWGCAWRVASLFYSESMAAETVFAAEHPHTVLPQLWMFLSGFIVAAILYVAFCYIPHHKFYTSTGNLLLFHIMALMGVAVVDSIEYSNNIAYGIYAFGMALLCLITACRTDRLNVREKDARLMPVSICATRAYYGLIWPWFMCMYFGSSNSFFVARLMTLIMIVVCYIYLAARVVKNGAASWLPGNDPDLSSKNSMRMTIPRSISMFSSAAAILILLISHTYNLISNLLPAHPLVYFFTYMSWLLIPLMFLLMVLREVFADKEKSKQSVSVLSFSLIGWSTLAIVLPFVLQVFDGLNVHSFFLKWIFIVPLLALLILLYRVFTVIAKIETTSAMRGAEYFALVIAGITVCYRFLGIEKAAIPAIPIIVGLMMVCLIFLCRKEKTAILGIATTLLTWNVIGTAHYYITLLRRDSGFPVALEIALYLIPILVCCIILLFRKKTPMKNDALFWGTLASQISLFAFIVPGITLTANAVLRKEMVNVVRFSSNTFDTFTKAYAFSCTRCHYAFIAWLGFFMIEAVSLLIHEEKKEKNRAIALMIFTLSTIVWMPMIKIPALSYIVEQCYLIPGAVFMVLLPWLFPKKEETSDPMSVASYKDSIYWWRFAYSIFAMCSLALIALLCNDLFSLIVFGVIATLMLVISTMMQKKAFTILSVICVVGMLAYIANRVWGNMAWWIYLFATGAFLIVIAVRNEIKKRKQNS
ncbi:MAG: hypothetical protein J6Y08_04805 [Clostridiales bacterium]|nr:hypothetical protein [Clostridiales bacterium]